MNKGKKPGLSEEKERLLLLIEEQKKIIDRERERMNQVYLTEDPETIYRENQKMDKLVERYLELKEELEKIQ